MYHQTNNVCIETVNNRVILAVFGSAMLQAAQESRHRDSAAALHRGYNSAEKSICLAFSLKTHPICLQTHRRWSVTSISINRDTEETLNERAATASKHFARPAALHALRHTAAVVPRHHTSCCRCWQPAGPCHRHCCSKGAAATSKHTSGSPSPGCSPMRGPCQSTAAL